MDIKWKKSKGILGLFTWFLGIYCLIFVLLSGIYAALASHPKSALQAAINDDYQQTEEFKGYIEERLGLYISMAEEQIAARDQVIYSSVVKDTSASSVIITDDFYSSIKVKEKEPAASFAIVSEEAVELGPEITTDSSVEIVSAIEITDAQAYHEVLKKDENILYTISYEDEILFTNEASLGLFNEEIQLPEGYNLLLAFDGEKVIGRKNLEESSFFGKYPTEESQKKIQVCMAVIEVPYVISEGENRFAAMYQIRQKMLQVRSLIFICIAMLAGGTILLAVSYLLRKERIWIRSVIAHSLGKLLYEPKLIALLFMLGLTNAVLIQTIDFGGSISSYAKGQGWVLSAGILLVFIILWIIYIDSDSQEKAWHHSILAYFIRLYHKKNQRYPAGVRMMKRIAFIFIAEMISALLFIAGMCTLSPPYVMILFLFLVNLILVIIQVSMWNTNKKLGEDMDLLLEQIALVHDGTLSQELILMEDSEIAEAALKLNDISKGMVTAMEEQMRSERMKIELVTNVSHDIKTPLTSIISYVELLKQETELPDYVKEYVSILESKSKRLKTMVQDVFEVSKAASGQLPVHIELLDLCKLLHQTLADMEEVIQETNFAVKENISKQPLLIAADGERMYRVFQNLIGNALNYSLDGTRIYVDVEQDGETAVAYLKNTSREELQQGMDFTERFLRGDVSRTDGGSGLGLSIARSFTEACGGELYIETNADLFVVSVRFPLVKEVQDRTVC